MSQNKNPFGLHTVTPYLIVNDVKRLINYLSQVFEAELRGDLSMRGDGSVQHAELVIGDSIIMMGEPLESLGAITVSNVGLYVYVDDCDLVFKKAVDAGGEVVLDIQDFPHGDRYGGVKDFSGNTWWIVTHVGT